MIFKIVALFLLVWAGAFRLVSAAEVVDRIVAVVNDDIILLSDLNKASASLEAGIRSKGYDTEKEMAEIFHLRQELLNSLIDDKLADQEIKSSGIFVDDAEVDRAIEQVKKANFYSDEDLRRALTASGMSLTDYRNEIKKQMHRNQLVNQKVKSKIIITESDIAEYYESHPEAYATRDKYLIRNIIMPLTPDMSPARQQAVREKMEQAHQRLADGASFEETAKAYSEAMNASDGGKLGLFALDELAENIRAAVAPLAPGKFSSIVETDQGLQIFWVEDIQAAGGREFTEAADDIRQKLYEEAVNKKFESWIDALRKDAHIKIIQ